MTQTNLLDRAKQGDPQAIATLMNRSLQPRGITADVELQGNCLRVALEAEQVPNRQALTAFVQNGIGNLGIRSIQSIKVMGRQIGASVPAWMHEIILDTPADEAATDPTTTGVPTPEVDLLPPTPLPMRPTPPPAPPFRPAIVPLVGEEDTFVADVPVSPSENAPANASTNFPESQFEPLDLESLDLDNLGFEEFDEEEGAPLSNADFGFPEDSELEEAIANDFGVSNSRSRGISSEDDTFTNSLDDLGLGALDDQPDGDDLNREAIAGDLNQFDQPSVNLNSLEEFDFGDELSDGAAVPEDLQPASESIDTADLLASLDFEDGLDLEGLDLTNESTLASDLNILQSLSEPVPGSLDAIDFERDLNEDDLATGSEIPTDPLSELDFEDAFNEDALNEDAFKLNSDLDTNSLSDMFLDEFGGESNEVLPDPLAALDLEEQLGFEPTAQVTGESAPDLLTELELEDEFQFDVSLDETSLDEASLGEDSLSEASWNLDEEPVSDSWLTENLNAEISTPESDSDSWRLDDTNAEIPAEISIAETLTDEASPLAFPDQFNPTDELSPDPLGSLPTYSPDYALAPDPVAATDEDNDFSFAADLDLPESFPDLSSEADLPADLSNRESSSFLDFNDLQDNLGQADLGAVELVDSPDDDLPPELLVDDIAMPLAMSDDVIPDDSMPDGSMPGYPSFSDTDSYGTDPHGIDGYDMGNDSVTHATYSDEDSAEGVEDVMLDWMTESAVEPSFDAFPESDETEQEEAWRQDLVQEPTLEGFSAIAPPDFYLDTAPPGSPLEPTQEDRTLESDLVDSNRLPIESFEPFPDLPVSDVQSSPVDAAVPPPLANQREESIYPPEEQAPVVEQGDSGWSWANVQTEADTMPAPGYFQSDEATSPDRSLLIEDADPPSLSLEPATGETVDWEADAAVDSPSDSSSRAPNRLTSSVLLFLIGWVALLIGYSLWTNLTAPPPAPPQPGVPQQVVPPDNPSVAPVPPPVPPADPVAPPPQPLPGEPIPPVPPAN